MAILYLSNEDIKRCVIKQAVDEGDPLSITAFGPDGNSWKPSTEEYGKKQSFEVMTSGIVNAITGSLSPTGDFDIITTNLLQSDTGDFGLVNSNIYKISGNNGLTITRNVISSIRQYGITGSYQYKQITESFTSGLLISSVESGWINF